MSSVSQVEVLMSVGEIERTKQIFRFLKAFAERKLPVRRTITEQLWNLRLRDLPRHGAIAVARVTLADTASTADGAETATQEPHIRVRRPRIAPPPKPPASVVDWLQPALNPGELPILVVASW